MNDPRNMTLGEYAQNADGETYSAVLLAEWMFAAMTGKLLETGEAALMVEDARKRVP